MRILSFDVGVCNLAFVVCEVMDGKLDIKNAELVNIMFLTHERVHSKNCSIPHTREISDRVRHFIQEYEHRWGSPDLVLIERQPIHGITSVECLLFQHFRTVAVKISPNQVHRWMGIQHLNYEGRKESSIFHAEPWLSNFSNFQHLERKHDVADALMLVFFYLRDQGESFLRVRHWADFAAPPTKNASPER